MSFHPTVQNTAITLALITACGILVHDTRVDKAVSLVIAVPAALASVSGVIPRLAGDGHNHIERVSLANAVRDLHNGTPRIQPREDYKKYHLAKHVVKGAQPFDGYYQPLMES